MSSRTEDLAKKVEQSINNLRAAVEESTPEQWVAPCSHGDWTQGFAAYHAAAAIDAIAQAVKSVAEGNPFPKMTMAEIDARNAVQWREHAGCTMSETMDLINSSASSAVGMVRSLSDAQLERKVQLLDGMPEVAVETMIELALVGHASYHAGTIIGARQKVGPRS